MTLPQQIVPRLEDLTTLEEAVAYVNHFTAKSALLEAELDEFKAALWAMRDAWAARHGEDPRLWPTDVLKALQPLGGAW